MNTPSWDPLNGGSITPSVRNEFGTLKTAILNPIASPEMFAPAFGRSIEAMDEEFRRPTHPEKHKLLYAHQKNLRERGVRIVHPHHPNLQPTLQNIPAYIGKDIYCRDFLGVVDETAILSSLSSYRNEMRGHYQRIMERIPNERQAQCDSVFTWGNAILGSETLMVGLEHPDYIESMYRNLDSARFTEMLGLIDMRNQGIRTMRHILQEIGSTREVMIFPLILNTDLDTVLAPLPRRSRTEPRQAIVSEEGMHPAALPTLLQQYDKLIRSPDAWSKLGCNILWLDPETPLVSAEATRTIQLLQSLKYNVQTRPVAPLEQDSVGHDDGQSGGWRCVTGVLERANDYPY